jgi:hypothetical protein
LINSPGFELTCYIQKWWRQTRLQSTVKLTLTALGDQYAEIEKAYFATTPCSSLFFIQEALDFLDFIIQAKLPINHLDAIAQFERAMLMAASATTYPSNSTLDVSTLPRNQLIKCHYAASIINLTAPPSILLNALLLNNPLPPKNQQQFPLLIAPGLEKLWRPATLDEVKLFACCQPVSTVENLLNVVNTRKQCLNDLLNIGALQVCA